MEYFKEGKEYKILDIKSNEKYIGIFKGTEKWNDTCLYMFLVKLEFEEVLAHWLSQEFEVIK